MIQKYHSLLIFIFFLFLIQLFSCKNNEKPKDPGGYEYQIVEVGKQVWMNENLKVKIDGESFCYNDNPAECDSMGRIYTWSGAIQAAEKIPGWHLPSKAEWLELIAHFGGDSLAYQTIMKHENSFKPQAAGVRLSSGKYVAKKFKGVNYWSCTTADTNETLAYSVAFMKHLNKISPHNYPKQNGCSIRLVKDR